MLTLSFCNLSNAALTVQQLVFPSLRYVPVTFFILGQVGPSSTDCLRFFIPYKSKNYVSAISRDSLLVYQLKTTMYSPNIILICIQDLRHQRIENVSECTCLCLISNTWVQFNAKWYGVRNESSVGFMENTPY